MSKTEAKPTAKAAKLPRLTDAVNIDTTRWGHNLHIGQPIAGKSRKSDVKAHGQAFTAAAVVEHASGSELVLVGGPSLEGARNALQNRIEGMSNTQSI